MPSPVVPIAIISGSVGVGKSTVGSEVSEILEAKGIPHTFIDFDQLSYTYPRSADDRWGSKLALMNLRDVWTNCLQFGSRNLVIASVVEDTAAVDDFRGAIANSKVTTFQLSANVTTLQSRVRKREVGSGLNWHLNRTVELAQILSGKAVPCDRRIETEDRAVIEVANEIVESVAWQRS